MHSFTTAYKRLILLLSFLSSVVLLYFLVYIIKGEGLLSCKAFIAGDSVKCHSCGITRGVGEILKGNFREGVELNKNAFLCLIIVISAILFRLPFLLMKSINPKKILFFEVVLVVVIFCLNQMILNII